MADANSTATTPEELAKQFPCTGSPFAVWCNTEAGIWVNDENGEATTEFADMDTALRWMKRQEQALAKVTGADTVEIALSKYYDFSNSMRVFIDLMESEVKKHNNTDFDTVEVLVKAAKAEFFCFDRLAVDSLPEAEESAREPGSTVHDSALDLSTELAYLDDYLDMAGERATQSPDGKLLALLDAAIPRLKRAREIANRLEVSHG